MQSAGTKIDIICPDPGPSKDKVTTALHAACSVNHSCWR